MAKKSGRKEGTRLFCLYRYFDGKQSELISLLDRQNIGKRELERMFRAKPKIMPMVFNNPMGSMRFKHIVTLAVILDKTVGEIADMVLKGMEYDPRQYIRKNVEYGREYADINRDVNREHQRNLKVGNVYRGKNWDYDVD